jgi:hypothetical protein
MQKIEHVLDIYQKRGAQGLPRVHRGKHDGPALRSLPESVVR